MAEFTFENQGTNTYLVYAVSTTDVVDSMSLGMITNNKILGLAATQFTQIDDRKYIKYNVSAKVSVKQFFTGAVNKKRLLGVFKGIVNALLAAEDYMIDDQTILLDLDYIFADVTTCETVLICLPIQDYRNQQDLGAFFKNIMVSTQFDQTENCDHVAKIFNYLNSTPLLSLVGFRKLLDSIDKEVVQVIEQPKVQEVKRPQVETPSQPVVNKNVIEPDVNHSLTATNIPTKKKEPVAPQVFTPPVKKEIPEPEKKISMFGLLMHYNKENAELYKAQKAAKKLNKGTAKKPVVTQQKSNSTANQNFAVPSTNQNFAIPGTNQSFAISDQSVAPKSESNSQHVQPKVNNISALDTPKPVAPVSKPASAPVSMPVQQPAYIPREVPQGQPANFGETTVLRGAKAGETTVLNAVNNPIQMIAPHLIRKKNNEKISLNKPVFRIGKEKSYVDYFIGDNTAISRSHANIISRDGKYFVVDTNSTNHTFVNGTMLQSNQETAIVHGDTIRFANEDFDFKLY